MAAARGLVSKLKLLQLQAPTITTTQRLSVSGMGVGALAGLFSAAAVASASASDGGNTNAAACPAYPWPTQDGARGGGQKVFMQQDCAACHSMLPYAGLAVAAAGGGEVQAKKAEIVVVHEVARPAPETTLHGRGGSCPPDLSVIAKMLEGLRHSDLYNAEELKKRMALPTPVWLQFLQPYMRNPQAA